MEHNTLLGVKGLRCEIFHVSSMYRIDILNEFLRKNDSKIVAIQPIGKGDNVSSILVTYVCE